MAMWVVVLVLVIGCAGAVTYYYHLYEPTDQEESADQRLTIEASRPTGSYRR